MAQGPSRSAPPRRWPAAAQACGSATSRPARPRRRRRRRRRRIPWRLRCPQSAQRLVGAALLRRAIAAAAARPARPPTSLRGQYACEPLLSVQRHRDRAPAKGGHARVAGAAARVGKVGVPAGGGSGAGLVGPAAQLSPGCCCESQPQQPSPALQQRQVTLQVLAAQLVLLEADYVCGRGTARVSAAGALQRRAPGPLGAGGAAVRE